MTALRIRPIAWLFGLIWAWAAAAALGETLGPPPSGAFSIVVIPDTQAYLGRGTEAQPESQAPVSNAALEAHTKWILDNLQKQQIVFVSHVGDVVDRNVPEQWEVAARWMGRLDGRVPYGISPGNHDMKANGESALFGRSFPAAKFARYEWYGGCFSGNNANSFQRFRAGGRDYLFLHLECNAPDAVLQWADRVLADNAQRVALVTTHMGLGPLLRPAALEEFKSAPKGRMQWKKTHGPQGNTPEQMWQKCFRKHANLRVIFSGDQSRTQAMHQASRTDAGTPVYEILSDYGPPWLRVCRFVSSLKQIRIWTIDSRDGSLCEGTKLVPGRAEHQFTIPFDTAVAAPGRP